MTGASPVAVPVAGEPAPWALAGLVALVGALAWVGATQRSLPPRAVAFARSARSVAPPPVIQPEILIEMTPDRARRINAAIPFLPGTVEAARPFRFAGDKADRERAVTCLAAALWYEAGDDPDGQEPVAQVVLNRVRHPAFPKTVCGVVFQGASLRTGCQFSFTCDGSITRRPPPEEAWERARKVAGRALDGHVDKAVGTATHYHTDWVVPYWSGSLDKIAAVGTHLFFKWRGLWGERAAFTGKLQPDEPIDARLLPLADASKLPVAVAAREGEPPATAAADAVMGTIPVWAMRGSRLLLADPVKGDYVIELHDGVLPASYRAIASALCGARAVCSVSGWLVGQPAPSTLPVPPSRLRTAAFRYRKNAAAGLEQALWNCARIPIGDPASCMPGTETPPPGAAVAPPIVQAPPPTASALPVAPPPQRPADAVPVLEGVTKLPSP